MIKGLLEKESGKYVRTMVGSCARPKQEEKSEEAENEKQKERKQYIILDNDDLYNARLGRGLVFDDVIAGTA